MVLAWPAIAMQTGFLSYSNKTNPWRLQSLHEYEWINTNDYFSHLKVGTLLLSMMGYPETIKEKNDKFEYMKIKNLNTRKTIKRKVKKGKAHMGDNCFMWSQMCKELLPLIKEKINISLEKWAKDTNRQFSKKIITKKKLQMTRPNQTMKRYSLTFTNNLSNDSKNECLLSSVDLAKRWNPGLERVWADMLGHCWWEVHCCTFAEGQSGTVGDSRAISFVGFYPKEIIAKK